ncbi:hypothetical protein N656DRAFT_781388 [Canariomyces notabilis]|uniref:FAD-binding FR-type domain-containing protein n=1 Tax=Canariomyces notabilis TaxID=2074819 RepID=A0AAN6QQH4_9PEZI|nr:hypothetical protein N656DRAFT_781388 [Canariomyces arenarius]
MSKESHIERTANEPRDPSLHTLTISHITQVTPTIRLFRLQIHQNDSITFLAGQWVDLYPPPSSGITKPGGFTITSSPSWSLPSPSSYSTPPYIELAIQSSPENPPAAYMFQPPAQILHTEVKVRIGGSFVFPPPHLHLHSSPATSIPNSIDSSSITVPQGSSGEIHASPLPLRKVVLVASGMGINPLMSMLSFIGEQQHALTGTGLEEVRLLYGVRRPRLLSPEQQENGGESGGRRGNGDKDDNDHGEGGILFLERIARIFPRSRGDERGGEGGLVRGGVRLFLTSGNDGSGASAVERDSGERGRDGGVLKCDHGRIEVPFLRRRMTVRDVEEAIGDDKEGSVVYICGVPTMTDEFVQALVSPEGFGMDKNRVLFEKWW